MCIKKTMLRNVPAQDYGADCCLNKKKTNELFFK